MVSVAALYSTLFHTFKQCDNSVGDNIVCKVVPHSPNHCLFIFAVFRFALNFVGLLFFVSVCHFVVIFGTKSSGVVERAL